MDETNLLLIIYCDDKRGECVRALNGLLERASDAELAIYANGKRHVRVGAEAIDGVPLSFNIVEGRISVPSPIGSVKDYRKLEIRYRPAASSKAWAPLPGLDPTGIRSIDEQTIWNMFMSLRPFEHKSHVQAKHFGCLEVFGRSLPKPSANEEGVSDFLHWTCPELVRCNLWGIADYLPFRNLTLQEEWEAAQGPLLWSDLSVIKDSWHQYLFKTEGTSPATQLPNTGVTCGPLTIYKLERPRWVD